MKREEIIAKWSGMSARERDAWIAQVVIGTTVFHCGLFTYEAYDNSTGLELPQYSTDISAAWDVVDEMREDHFVSLTDCGPFGWRVGVETDDDRVLTYSATSESVEEAIGLAAIIAKLATED